MGLSREIRQFRILQIIDHNQFIREIIFDRSLHTNFSFKAGQFLMLHVPVEGDKPALRAYSIASSENDHEKLHLIFKIVPNGIASTYVWRLNEGAILDMTGPFGKLFFNQKLTDQILFLNTGSGLAQHYSYLMSNLKLLQKSKIRMLIGLNYESEIYYKDQLDSLAKQLSDFSYEYVIREPQSNWTGKTGYIQHHIEELNYIRTPTTFYLCGNGNMIRDTKKMLIETKNISPNNILSESFGG